MSCAAPCCWIGEALLPHLARCRSSLAALLQQGWRHLPRRTSSFAGVHSNKSLTAVYACMPCMELCHISACALLSSMGQSAGKVSNCYRRDAPDGSTLHSRHGATWARHPPTDRGSLAIETKLAIGREFSKFTTYATNASLSCAQLCVRALQSPPVGPKLVGPPRPIVVTVR